MTVNWKRLGTTAAILVLPLLLTRCLITEVQQPASVAKGTQVTVTVKGYDDQLPSNGAETDKGVLCILVPNDWSFVSATYKIQERNKTKIDSGKMVAAQNWKDSATATIAPPAGMKWIGMLSDSAYKYTDTLSLTAVVKLQVGQTLGTYNLGYLMTKNGNDLISHFSDGWSDTLMNQKITVTASQAVEELLGGKPSEYHLYNNYPNPFNPATTILFSLKDRGNIHLAVYDVTGREVALLAEGFHEAGQYRVSFAPEGLASGIYFYTLRTSSFTETHKMVFSK